MVKYVGAVQASLFTCEGRAAARAERVRMRTLEKVTENMVVSVNEKCLLDIGDGLFGLTLNLSNVSCNDEVSMLCGGVFILVLEVG